MQYDNPRQDISASAASRQEQAPISIITLLTDFGTTSTFVGTMKGVILSIAPTARIIDLTHAVPSQDIAQGMWNLEFSYRYFPAGTIFVCVVDPGVGSARTPIALHAGDWYFIGPDNGIFTMVLQEQAIHSAVRLTNPEYRLERVSATFQGRDLFAPAGAYLSTGIPLREFGDLIDPQQLQRLEIEQPEVIGKRIQGAIIHEDQYGNLISNITTSLLPADDRFFTEPGIRLFLPKRQVIIEQRRHYFAEQPSDAQAQDEPFIYIDSTNYLAIAVQNGNAARTLGVGAGEPITLQLP